MSERRRENSELSLQLTKQPIMETNKTSRRSQERVQKKSLKTNNISIVRLKLATLQYALIEKCFSRFWYTVSQAVITVL